MKKIFFLSLLCCCFIAHGQSAGEYIERGVAKYENGDYTGAIKEYSKAIEENPNSITSYFNRGLAKIKLSDYRGAIADFSRNIELNSGSDEGYSLRGECKMELKDYPGAMEDYNKAIELEPTAQHYTKRGLLKYRMVDFRGSISDCATAINLDPKNSDGYLIQGVSKIALEDVDGGCLDLSKAGELGNPNAYRIIKDLCNDKGVDQEESLAQSLVDYLNEFIEPTNHDNTRNFARLENNFITIYFETYMDLRPSDDKELAEVFREVEEGSAEEIALKILNGGFSSRADRKMVATSGITRINFIFLTSYADQTESRVERYLLTEEFAGLNAPSTRDELLSILKKPIK